METPSLTRRHAVAALLGAGATALLAACQTPAQPTPASRLAPPKAAPGQDVTPVLASSELAVGRNRLTLGLLDSRNRPITEGTVRLEFFKVDASRGSAQKRSESEAVFRAVTARDRGVWVSPASFDEAGPWGAQVALTRPDAPVAQVRLSFTVQERFSAPGYGDPAPRSASPTASGGDVARICSASPPCEMHAVSIADALASGQKPLVAIFATPGFCASATCAPELDAVRQLRASYADRASFVHVEIYQHPFEEQKVARTVDEWRLPSDPWVFVVDRSGVVRDRFEGASPAEELEPALEQVL